jgi:ankyrin repeat protein
MHAADTGHADILIHLLDYGGREHVNDTNDKKQTCLMLASRSEHIECVRVLLAVPGIRLDDKDSEGHTALDISRNPEVRSALAR